jgi:phage-related protein
MVKFGCGGGSELLSLCAACKLSHIKACHSAIADLVKCVNINVKHQPTFFMANNQYLKELIFVASAKKALQEFPLQVRRDIGFALYQVQQGKTTRNSKPLKGFGCAGVLEIIEDYDGDTYRAVYTVKFENVLYILHCFQKKSKKGKATPKEDIDLIKQQTSCIIFLWYNISFCFFLNS